jgi:hypothetical protein
MPRAGGIWKAMFRERPVAPAMTAHVTNALEKLSFRAAVKSNAATAGMTSRFCMLSLNRSLSFNKTGACREHVVR